MRISVVSSLLYKKTASDSLTARGLAETCVANMRRLCGEKDERYYEALETLCECYDFYDLATRPLCEHMLDVASKIYGKGSQEVADVKDRLLWLGKENHDMEYALDR